MNVTLRSSRVAVTGQQHRGEACVFGRLLTVYVWKHGVIVKYITFCSCVTFVRKDLHVAHRNMKRPWQFILKLSQPLRLIWDAGRYQENKASLNSTRQKIFPNVIWGRNFCKLNRRERGWEKRETRVKVRQRRAVKLSVYQSSDWKKQTNSGCLQSLSRRWESLSVYWLIHWLYFPVTCRKHADYLYGCTATTWKAEISQQWIEMVSAARIPNHRRDPEEERQNMHKQSPFFDLYGSTKYRLKLHAVSKALHLAVKCITVGRARKSSRGKRTSG